MPATDLQPPAPRLPSSPIEYLRLFGPGAVIASLTIGSGELIFSSRGGALFGYRLLWFFGLVLLFKWVLLYATARQMILAGTHPFQRWMDLPGPRGWFPVALLLLSLIAFPIWVSFHAGTVGTLLSWFAGTDQLARGGAHYLWGILTLGCVLGLVLRGGYATLEKVQLLIVILMLLAVVISLILLHPPWLELVRGFLIPGALEYPGWATAIPELKQRPVWVETVMYVGVIGGSGYDYLAYLSYLRDKGWGQARVTSSSANRAAAVPEEKPSDDSGWLRVVLVDCTLSFAAVLIFSSVFVACGALILRPEHKIPSGTSLLDLQAAFVALHPWMKPLYFIGAFLTMLGTLYGTIEVAPTVLREVVIAFNPAQAAARAAQLRRWSVLWAGWGGLIILTGNYLYAQGAASGELPGLIPMLTPANLFTGVLLCGLICLLNPWSERGALPARLRMSWPLLFLNWLAGIAFLALGLKAYWDHNRWTSLGILAGTVVLAGACATVLRARKE